MPARLLGYFSSHAPRGNVFLILFVGTPPPVPGEGPANTALRLWGRGSKEQACVDSFVAFVSKVTAMTSRLKVGQLAFLQKQGVSFNGTKMDRTLYYAVIGLMENLLRL